MARRSSSPSAPLKTGLEAIWLLALARSIIQERSE
jgi:hypothetical protein